MITVVRGASWPRVQDPDKEGGWNYELGLVGFHPEGVFPDMSFAASGNWLAPGDGGASRVSRAPDVKGNL